MSGALYAIFMPKTEYCVKRSSEMRNAIFLPVDTFKTVTDLEAVADPYNNDYGFVIAVMVDKSAVV